MDTGRRNAAVAGVLFIAATVAGVLSLGLVSELLDDPGYLTRIATSENQLLMGALLQLVMAAACSGIAISMYPVLRKHSEGLALGSVVFRGIEAALFVVGALFLTLLLTLGQEFVKAGSPASSQFQTLGVVLKAGFDSASTEAAQLAWCLGALMYYYVFYQTKLVPRWLSGWGLVGIALSIATVILAMFHVSSSTSTIDTVLHLPIFFQEMVLAVWLIAKGFDASAIVSLSVGEMSPRPAVTLPAR
jgi:Domain of unknown function (DUF4386)